MSEAAMPGMSTAKWAATDQGTRAGHVTPRKEMVAQASVIAPDLLACITGRIGQEGASALLASDLDGEHSAAAWTATGILRDAGLTWADVIAPPLPPLHPPRHAYPSGSHATPARWTMQFSDWLAAWECSFLVDLGRRPRPSPNQAAALAGILERLRAGGVA